MKDQKILLEKVEGGYIVAEPNPEPKNPSEVWVNKSVHDDFESAMEDIRRRLGVSSIIASNDGRLQI
jgi:hypothetical protein